MELEPMLLQAALPGPAMLFIGFFMVMFIYSGALLFTYWISKDE
ncbi:hypothetical protein BH20ACT11_BH20ACT11_08370 [soil metagenome]